MIQAIYRIAHGLCPAGPLPAAALQRELVARQDARTQTNEALRRWEAIWGPGTGGSSFTGTLALSDTVTAGIGAARPGGEDPGHPVGRAPRSSCASSWASRTGSATLS
ncbi:MAG: hypothetical protein AB1505_10680 [Candidatus Latescibacterota bacterium]